jgi:hypothetical protein
MTTSRTTRGRVRGTARAMAVLTVLATTLTCTSSLDLRTSDITLDLASSAPQSGSFVLDDAGAYDAWAWLETANGPDHGPGTHRLKGTATVRDEDGDVVLTRRFEEDVERGTIGFALFPMSEWRLGGSGGYEMTVQLEVDGSFRAYYRRMSIRITPCMRLVDIPRGF